MSARVTNGWPSWAAWNVALWTSNDPALYALACEAMARSGYRPRLAARWAVGLFPARTPDGARVSVRSLELVFRAFDRPN